MVIKTLQKLEFRSIFQAPSHNFKILTIPIMLAYGKSYKHRFVKKRDGHKHCIKSSFDSCNVLKFQNTSHSQRIIPWEVVQAWFHEKM
ncbi:hypothetical protein BHM03_00009638 [Ensete ventricosum]|nr:hypothetical protein BHM03_00009638 [Ensete ventricosum]